MVGAVDVDLAQLPGVVEFVAVFLGRRAVGAGQAGQGFFIGGLAVEIDPDMVELVLEELVIGVADGRAEDVLGALGPEVGGGAGFGRGFVLGHARLGEIVIDELAGMWLTLSICGLTSENILFTAPLAFIFFRLFDIYKPSIIGRIDRNVKGGLGVMGDDVIAGIFAGICTALSWQLIDKFII